MLGNRRFLCSLRSPRIWSLIDFFQCGYLITARHWTAAVGSLPGLGEYPDSHLYIFAFSFFSVTLQCKVLSGSEFSATTIGISLCSWRYSKEIHRIAEYADLGRSTRIIESKLSSSRVLKISLDLAEAFESWGVESAAAPSLFHDLVIKLLRSSDEENVHRGAFGNTFAEQRRRI